MDAQSEEDRLYRELASAEGKWTIASTELNEALRYPEDLLNPDGGRAVLSQGRLRN